MLELVVHARYIAQAIADELDRREAHTRKRRRDILRPPVDLSLELMGVPPAGR